MTRSAPATVTGAHVEAPAVDRATGNGHGNGAGNGLGVNIPRAPAGTVVLDPAVETLPEQTTDRATGRWITRRSRAVVRPPAVRPGAVPASQAVPLAILVAVGFVLLLALMLRVAAARQLSTQVDEPATLLAAHQIAERGLPILPSDTLYLHGATLSYALVPFVRLGHGDLEDLKTVRLVSVLAGVAAVGLTFLLALRISGAPWAGVVAAFFLAVDPISVQWSAHARMYALLQALTLVIVLLYLRALVRPVGRRGVVWLVVAFWLAILTHIGAALLWPAMAAVAVLAYGRGLLRARRDLLVALGLCLLAPLTLSTLNRLFQPRDYRETVGIPFFSFAGEGLFNLRRLRDPHPSAWRALFGDGYARDFMPLLVLALIGLLVGRYVLAHGAPGNRARTGSASERERRLEIGVLVAIYGSAVLVISFFTWDQEPRYLLNVHPIGFALLAAGLAVIARSIRAGDDGNLLLAWRRWLPQSATIGAAVLLTLIVLADGLAVRLRDPFVDTDQVTGLAYVAAHRQPGELVIVSLPPAPYLALGGDEEMVFLAGSDLTTRVQRYTRLTADGRTVDYWIGVDAITSTEQLCQLLITRPDAWLILDEDRLRQDWAYGGEMEETILRMTELVAEAPGGVLIYRRLVPEDGAAFEAPTCGGHTTIPVETGDPAPAQGPRRREP
jgi:hypothetical protein